LDKEVSVLTRSTGAIKCHELIVRRKITDLNATEHKVNNNKQAGEREYG